MGHGQSQIEKHPQFPTVLEIVKKLNKKGYLTVLAGGCVRDSLLGRVPKDLDLATAAPPDEVEKLFSRTLAVGKAFGTIVVIENGHNFEVTTFRSEGPYVDGRHPEHVSFTNIAEDASRRDFTINALFYDPIKREVLDFVGGIEDLDAHLIRTVGEPRDRFKEDHLRMLRAARFVAQLGFALDVRAAAAMKEGRETLRQISAERIFAEIKRLLSSPDMEQGLNVLRLTGLAEIVWPEMIPVNLSRLGDFFVFTGWENAFAAVMFLTGSDPEPRLRAWKSSRETLKRVRSQIEGCEALLDSRTSTAERMKILGSPEFAEILILAAGAAPERIDDFQRWIEAFLRIAGPKGSLPAPLISGQDLLAAGMPPGEKMGRLLKSLYDSQLEGHLSSKVEALKKLNSF